MTTRPLFLTLCLASLTGLAAGPVLADDPAAAASALKVLTAHAQEAAHSAPAHASPARERFVVQRSETMDALIRRRWAGWPVKEEVFRHALADLNPGSIPNAANNLLKRGSTLQLPNTEDLRRTLQQHYPAAAELVRIRVEVETEEVKRSAQDSSGHDKRRWVRYP